MTEEEVFMDKKFNKEFGVKLIKNIGVFSIGFICFALVGSNVPNPKVKVTEKQFNQLVEQKDKAFGEYKELSVKHEESIKDLKNKKQDLECKNKELSGKLEELNKKLNQ